MADHSDAWAQRIAAQLPPFTADEIAELGRMAATIDARRAQQASTTSETRRAAA